MLQEHGQKLILNFSILEDEGSYECNVTNKFGSTVSIIALNIKGE